MAALLNSDGEEYSDGSSYNEDHENYIEEDEYEEESEEIVLEEELPHEEDEYTESDSYEYPYPTSSDDSWAELSSDEAIQKIIEKLPTYSSESSGDEQAILPPELQSASDSDAGSFIQHNDEKEYNADIIPSQIEEYQPISYINSIETYNIYIVSHSDDDADADDESDYHSKKTTKSIKISKPSSSPTSPSSPSSSTISLNTPLPSTPKPDDVQGQQQQDQPPPDHQLTPITPIDHQHIHDIDDIDSKTETIITTESPTVKIVKPIKNNQHGTSPKDSIQPTQSEIPIIDEDVATEFSDSKTDIIPEPTIPRYRGKDAPRRMTKTRIVIKKVKAKRAPKRFKEGMKVKIKNNKNVTTPYDGVTGHIRYVGVIDNDKMIGIEIFDEDIMGETDGTYNDQRYFQCADKKGVFVSIKNVKKFINTEARRRSDEFKKASRERRRTQRNNAQMYGNIVDNLWQQRIDLVRSNKYKIVRKAGPREFGRIEYFGGDEEYSNALNDHTHFLEPRLTLPRKQKGAKEFVTPKPGPRDIGRIEEYVGIQYDEAEIARKRAKKKKEIEEKKRKKFEEMRLKKLEEGKITRADYPHKPIKKKKRSKSAMPNSKKKEKEKEKENDNKNMGGTPTGKKIKYNNNDKDKKQKMNHLEKPKKKNTKTKSLGATKKIKGKDKDKEKEKEKGGKGKKNGKLKLTKKESGDGSKKKGKSTKNGTRNSTKNGLKPKTKGSSTK